MILLKDMIRDVWIDEWKISWIETFIVQLSSIWWEFISKEEWTWLTNLKFEINWNDVLFRFKIIWWIFLQKLMIKEIDWEEVKVDFSDINQFKQ